MGFLEKLVEPSGRKISHIPASFPSEKHWDPKSLKENIHSSKKLYPKADISPHVDGTGRPPWHPSPWHLRKRPALLIFHFISANNFKETINSTEKHCISILDSLLNTFPRRCGPTNTKKQRKTLPKKHDHRRRSVLKWIWSGNRGRCGRHLPPASLVPSVGGIWNLSA